jgi:hypothetical protein
MRPRWPSTWLGATSTSSATWAWATGRFTVLTNDLTHEYIDENTGGS